MHVPTSPIARRLSSRDDGGTGKGGLSTSTIIVIAVLCGCFGILILTMFLWRLLARCCKPRESAPLPPVQDLAHRREQQMAAFTASRQSQWLSVSHPVLPAHASFQTGSSVSLLPASQKNSSGYIDDMTTVESSVNSPVTAESDPVMQSPNALFYPPAISLTSSPQFSMISADSSYSTLPRTVIPPPPSPQPAELRSVEGDVAQQQPVRSRSRTPSRNNMLQTSRGRPLSQISAGTSYSGHTMRSASTTRGAPHKPFSGVQIVLPAPLALDAAAPQRSSSYGRNSVFVDQWVAIGSRSLALEDAERTRKNSSASRRSQRSSSTPPIQSESRPLPPGSTATIPARPASAAEPTHPGAPSPPVPSSNRRTPSSQHSRSTSSLRNEVGQHTPPVPMPPARTYNSLADLAQSSFEINQFMRERGRAHVGVTGSPQLTPSSTFQSSPSSQQMSSASTLPQSRSRSQSRPRPQQAGYPVR
ncbi:hypothetical protein BC835DRAFT_167928 [Cytidiella melzeri]|nr:hypothetical protein BC835DRAFT_167928 [Cytidiella melzeri]